MDTERKARESREAAMCSGLRGEWEEARNKLGSDIADLRAAVKVSNHTLLKGTLQIERGCV